MLTAVGGDGGSPDNTATDLEKGISPRPRFVDPDRTASIGERLQVLVGRVKRAVISPAASMSSGKPESSCLPAHEEPQSGLSVNHHGIPVRPGFQRSSSAWTGHSRGSRSSYRTRQQRHSDAGQASVNDGPVHHVVVDSPFDPDEKEGTFDNRRWSKLTDEGWRASDEDGYESCVESGFTSVSFQDGPNTSRGAHTLWGWLYANVYQPLRLFVYMRFPEQDREDSFQRERWYAGKPGAVLGAIFLIFYWAMTTGTQDTYTVKTYYLYIGIIGLFIVPTAFFVVFNGPRRFNFIYQIWVVGACWIFDWVITAEMYQCHANTLQANCPNKSYQHFFVAGFPIASIGVISLQANRVVQLFVVSVVFSFGAWLYASRAAGPAMWRNIITFFLYHIFICILDYYREKSARQLWLVRQQLKRQYQAVQVAQDMERRAEATKKRFVAYIFHEVRVPLNTARLALSNLDEEGAFRKIPDDQQDLVVGLNASLRMMENVLNDVLSFTRMENGNLVLANAPFSLHRAVDYVALSHRAQREMRGLSLELDLDPRIDSLGAVLGDEMRFKQVCSNLVSNAFKFTQEGGVRIITRLLYPSSPAVSTRRVLIRVEVHDTGVGLCPSDLQENCLFSPYVQTEIGRRQGGKGSGLGLALIMQIIKLSKGRLGVDSQLGKGSVFWFEIPYFLEARLPRPAALPTVVVESEFEHSPTTTLAAQEATPPTLALDIGSFSSRTPRKHSNQPETPAQNESETGYSEPGSDSALIPSSSPLDPPRLALVESDPAPTDASEPPTRPPMRRASTDPTTKTEEVPRLSTLVVDDDALTRKLMSRTITRMGHDVQTAPNGAVALALILESPRLFDIVFLDNQMPLMSGVEVARALREAKSSIYVVGCTGNAMREDQEQYLQAGADFILPKPVDRGAILERLEEAARRKVAAIADGAMGPDHPQTDSSVDCARDDGAGRAVRPEDEEGGDH